LKDIDIEDKLCNFIKDFGDDLNSLELLVFFSRHPRAKFNRTAVIHALVTKHFDTGIALKRLIERNIVVTCNENGITLYSLTKEEPAHSLASELVNIDQQQWQKILEQILKAQGIQ
jgi:predicted methyltransferase